MRPAHLLLAFLLVGCAKKPPITPTPPKPEPMREADTGTRCPNAMWQPGQQRPGGIEIENRSADSVIVFLDRCLGHTRVADLGPNETDVFVLPNGASSYNGLLRFFTYRGSQKVSALELVQPIGEPYLKLVVPVEARAECPEVWINGKRSDSQLSRVPRSQIEKVEYIPTGANGECSRIMVRLKGS
jgi:hypothetical protein